jgi:hypothetical protein
VQDSLAGNGKTLMVVNAAPEESNAGETLCSLQFAARVRGVELGGAKRTVESGAEIKELMDELSRLRTQVCLRVLTHIWGREGGGVRIRVIIAALSMRFNTDSHHGSTHSNVFGGRGKETK